MRAPSQAAEGSLLPIPNSIQLLSDLKYAEMLLNMNKIIQNRSCNCLHYSACCTRDSTCSPLLCEVRSLPGGTTIRCFGADPFLQQRNHLDFLALRLVGRARRPETLPAVARPFTDAREDLRHRRDDPRDRGVAASPVGRTTCVPLRWCTSASPRS